MTRKRVLDEEESGYSRCRTDCTAVSTMKERLKPMRSLSTPQKRRAMPLKSTPMPPARDWNESPAGYTEISR